MLKATQEVIKLIKQPESNCYIDYLIDIINENGSIEDAKELFVLFKKTKQEEILTPIMLHGNEEISEDLFNFSFKNQRLKKDYPVSILNILSYLGNQKLEEILINYYKDILKYWYKKNVPWEFNSWEFHVSVCTSLLNYPCEGYEDLIEKEINKCLELLTFPELMPCLAIKTRKREYIDILYTKGFECDSDMNGGLILGLALFGEESRYKFKSIIWDEHWEASGGSTGSCAFTFLGMKHLNISITELYIEILIDIVQNVNKGIIEHKLIVIYNLLHAKVYDSNISDLKMIPKSNESFITIYNNIFDWRTEIDNSIIGIYKDYLKEDIFVNYLYEIKRLIELKIEKEIRTQFITDFIK